jgi:long-chain acyl-CoA synthetase
MREHRPTIMMAVPSMYGALLSVKDAGPDDFRSLRYAISGGEPLPDATFEAFLERFDVRLLEGYGLTETSPVTHWSTPEHYRRHAVGRALPGVTTLVVDEQDRPLPAGEEGEILLAGPNIMQGYYRQPELTAEVTTTIDRPGVGPTRFFRTGDMGKVDAEGYLYITGRKKDMMIIGGENVFPREIEEVLAQHEAVKAAAVIGQADGMRGEVPVAFVEVVDGETLDANAVRQFCRERLANYKVPREIHVVDELPRSPTGKVLRRHLPPEADDRSTS